jgi:hypothetical protein
LVTTNSITQVYGHKVVDEVLNGDDPVHLSFAISDHPWVDEAQAAQVRVSMTVIASGEGHGQLTSVVREGGLDEVDYRHRHGKITAKLGIGVNVSSALPLLANQMICTSGVTLVGKGFLTDKSNRTVERQLLRPYRNGRDINAASRDRLVIDTFGLDVSDLQQRFPNAYQWLSERVRPEREARRGRNSDADDYANRWWQFAKQRPELREALPQLHRYVVSTQTSRHRFFLFISSDVIPDIKLIAFVSQDSALVSVLSSRVHTAWSLINSGRLGVGNDPVYSTRNCFGTFPFPGAIEVDLPTNDPQRAQQDRLRELGERLDGFRKERLAEHSFLTMTGLYNALERLRELESGCNVLPLSDVERDIHQAGLISVLKEIHDDIDRATLTAFGWDDLISELVGLPGATLPSSYKTQSQEQAEEELLFRLVALNRERAAEERRGLVRWLRPEYQIPKLAAKAPKPAEEHVGVFDLELPTIDGGSKWPSDGLEQIRLVRRLLAKAPAPAPPDAIAVAFDGRNTAKRRDRIDEVLRTLVETGLARTGVVEGQTRYFLPRG